MGSAGTVVVHCRTGGCSMGIPRALRRAFYIAHKTATYIPTTTRPNL